MPVCVRVPRVGRAGLPLRSQVWAGEARVEGSEARNKETFSPGGWGELYVDVRGGNIELVQQPLCCWKLPGLSTALGERATPGWELQLLLQGIHWDPCFQELPSGAMLQGWLQRSGSAGRKRLWLWVSEWTPEPHLSCPCLSSSPGSFLRLPRTLSCQDPPFLSLKALSVTFCFPSRSSYSTT